MLLNQSLIKVVQLAHEMQQAYFDALKLSPQQAKDLADSFDPFFILIGGKYKKVFGLDQQFVNKAFSQLTDKGEISSKQNYTVQTIDSNKQAFITAYAIKKAFVESNFPQYQVKEQAGGQIFKDGVDTLHLDNLITQLALQDLIKVNEKQLDGIYNLPSGADFFVPIQTLQYAFNAGANSVAGGGGSSDFKGGIKGTSTTEITTPPDEVTKRAQDERVARKEQRVEEIMLEFSKAAIKQKEEATAPQPDNKKFFQPGLYPNSSYGYPKLFDNQGAKDLKSMSKSQDFTKPVETKLSLEMNSNVQLLVDGRTLATIIKQYLYEDLLRYEGVGGTVTRRIVL